MQPHRWAAHQAPPGILQGLPFPSPMHENEKWKWSCSVVPTLSDPMDCSLLSPPNDYQRVLTSLGKKLKSNRIFTTFYFQVIRREKMQQEDQAVYQLSLLTNLKPRRARQSQVPHKWYITLIHILPKMLNLNVIKPLHLTFSSYKIYKTGKQNNTARRQSDSKGQT